MTAKRSLLVVSCMAVLASLIGCPPPQSSDERGAEIFVTSTGQQGGGGYTPTGWGWKPGAKLEVSIWNEPDSPSSASTQWKKILDETVDPNSLFGFEQGAPFYPVRRAFCGAPVPGQSVVFMVKNTATGTIRMRQVPVDIYFTFQPCK